MIFSPRHPNRIRMLNKKRRRQKIEHRTPINSPFFLFDLYRIAKVFKSETKRYSEKIHSHLHLSFSQHTFTLLGFLSIIMFVSRSDSPACIFLRTFFLSSVKFPFLNDNKRLEKASFFLSLSHISHVINDQFLSHSLSLSNNRHGFIHQ